MCTGAAEDDTHILATGAFRARLARDRTILAIAGEPSGADLTPLVGERAGQGLRKLLKTVIPDELARASPLYLLLDDLSGASLVSGWTWSQWDPDWSETMRAAMTDPMLSAGFANRVGICTGFAVGSSAHRAATDRAGSPAPDLRNPADPEGFHAFPELPTGPAFRRARRIDLWIDDAIRIEAAFQDSANTPGGGRMVVHEYSLSLAADPQTHEIRTIDARPHVLPFVECPGAAANMKLLIGEPLSRLREIVLERLRGTAGCTHLNDALRALADAPILLGQLQPRSMTTAGT